MLAGGVRGEDKTTGVVVETAAVAAADAISRRLRSSARLLLLLLLLLQLPLLMAPCRIEEKQNKKPGR